MSFFLLFGRELHSLRAGFSGVNKEAVRRERDET